MSGKKEKKEHFQQKLFRKIEEHYENNFKLIIPQSLIKYCDGDLSTAAMLANLGYWCDRSSKADWIWKSRKEWREETGLTRKPLEKAVALLTSAGLLEIKKESISGHATLHYKLNQDAVMQSICSKEQLFQRAKVGVLKSNGKCPKGQTNSHLLPQRLPSTTPATSAGFSDSSNGHGNPKGKTKTAPPNCAAPPKGKGHSIKREIDALKQVWRELCGELPEAEIILSWNGKVRAKAMTLLKWLPQDGIHDSSLFVTWIVFKWSWLHKEITWGGKRKDPKLDVNPNMLDICHWRKEIAAKFKTMKDPAKEIQDIRKIKIEHEKKQQEFKRHLGQDAKARKEKEDREQAARDEAKKNAVKIEYRKMTPKEEEANLNSL